MLYLWPEGDEVASKTGSSILMLRDHGVYRLPSGTRLVAISSLQGTVVDLFDQYEIAWGAKQAKMRVQPDGRLTFEGKPTPWKESDLIDTGATQ